MKVYVRQGNLTVGPVPFADVVLAIERGQIKGSDLVCVDGATWVRADKVLALSSRFQPVLETTVLASFEPFTEHEWGIPENEVRASAEPVHSTESDDSRTIVRHRHHKPLGPEIHRSTSQRKRLHATDELEPSPGEALRDTASSESAVGRAERGLSTRAVVGLTGLTCGALSFGVLGISVGFDGTFNILILGMGVIVGLVVGALLGLVIASPVQKAWSKRQRRSSASVQHSGEGSTPAWKRVGALLLCGLGFFSPLQRVWARHRRVLIIGGLLLSGSLGAFYLFPTSHADSMVGSWCAPLPEGRATVFNLDADGSMLMFVRFPPGQVPYNGVPLGGGQWSIQDDGVLFFHTLSIRGMSATTITYTLLDVETDVVTIEQLGHQSTQWHRCSESLVLIEARRRGF